MGLEMIFSILAFFIAMVALWLTSDTVKKIEEHNEKFVRGHVATLRDEMRAMDNMLSKATRLAQNNEQGQVSLDQRLGEQDKTLRVLQEQALLISAKLEELDQSIPERLRVKPLKANPRQAPKASIQ